MQGTIVIGTKIDDKEFNRQIVDLQRKADKKQIDIDITSKKITSLEEEIKRAKEERDAYFKEYENLMAEQGRWEDLQSKGGYNLKGKELAEWQTGFLRDYDAEIEQLDKKMRESTVGNFEKVSAELEKQKEKLKDQQYEYNKIIEKIDTINQKQEQTQIEKVNSSLTKIGTSLGAVVKKVARWGLAIFGIRGAYMAVRNAINVISQDDETLKADIDYIKNALAYALEPVVRKVVEWAKQLVFYIGYVIKMWTGHDIFAIANKNLKKSVGSAKELKKQLAGFDEMNIISDNSGSGAGSGGGAMPSFNFEDMEVPKWIEEIGKLLDYFKDPTWENFGRVIQGLGVIVAGLGIAFLSLPAVIAGAIVLIIGTMMKYWEEIKAFIDNKIFAWLDAKIQNLNKSVFGKFFATFLEESKRIIGDVVHIFDGLFKSIRQIFDGIIKIFKGQFKEGFISIGKGIVNAIISVINGLTAGLNTLVAPLRAIIVGFGKIAGKNWSMENVRLPRINYLAKGGIVNMPSRGVPVGGAIAGERGQEGVIPLTNSQQMALLGEAIGKYININATVPVYVGNRMVAREIKRINAEDNFAYNR